MPLEQTSWVTETLAAMSRLRVAVCGDFCLDAYWSIDPSEEEKSIETGLAVRRVRGQRYSPGGAGNVVANLLDLGVPTIKAIGVVGTDPFGVELLRLLRNRGADLSQMMVLQPPWDTMVYAKPCVGDVEERRFDFGAFNELNEKVLKALDDSLKSAALECDVIVLNQQVPNGLISRKFIGRINEIIAEHPRTRFIVDSRAHAAEFRGAILKLNAREAPAVLGEQTGSRAPSTAEAKSWATRISRSTGQPVFLTRGKLGMVVADRDAVHLCNGIQLIGRTDPVGAGDTVVAVLAGVLGSGGDAETAAKLANIAASVTVRKYQMTGTAKPDEIIAAAAEANERRTR